MWGENSLSVVQRRGEEDNSGEVKVISRSRKKRWEKISLSSRGKDNLKVEKWEKC